MRKVLAVAVILLLCPIAQVLTPQPLGNPASKLLAAVSSATPQTIQSPPWWDTATDIGWLAWGAQDYFRQNQNVSGVGEVINRFGIEYAAGLVGSPPPFGEPWSSGISEAHAMGAYVGTSSSNYENSASDMLAVYNSLPADQRWKFPNGTIVTNPSTAGRGRTFNGCPVTHDPTIFNTEVDMDPSNPYWVNYLVNQAIEQINSGSDGIYFDNLFQSPLNLFGDFGYPGSWFDYNFSHYLASKYSPAQLSSMGVDLATFRFADYLSTHYEINSVVPCGQVNFKNPQQVLRDPIVQAWLAFQYNVQVDFIQKLYTSIKAYAASVGRQVVVHGNMGDTWNSFMVPGLLPYQDVVDLEFYNENGFYPPYGSPDLAVKTALAATNYSKPVWGTETYPSQPYPWLHLVTTPGGGLNGSLPADLSYLFQLEYGATFAAGGVPYLNFATGQDTNYVLRLLQGNERNSISPSVSFAQDAKGLLLNPQPAARVAIVVSQPTWYWNYVPALGIYPGAYFTEPQGWAQFLETQHLPYDVIIFGQPGVFNDTWQLSRLSDYDLVILPAVEILSNSQMAALKSYVAHGGHLIISGSFAQYDTNYNAISSSDLVALTSSPNVEVIPLTGDPYWSDLLTGGNGATPEATMLKAVGSALPVPQLLTNAPPRVVMNVVGQPSQGRLILDIVNMQYGANQTRDWVTDVPNVKVSLKVDPSYLARGVFLVSPDSPDPTQVTFTEANGYATFTIPKVHVWVMVVFGMSPSNYDTMKTAGRLAFILLPPPLAATRTDGLELSAQEALSGSARSDYVAGNYAGSISFALQAVNMTAHVYARFGQLLANEPAYSSNLASFNAAAEAGDYDAAFGYAKSAIDIGRATTTSLFRGVVFDQGHTDSASMSYLKATPWDSYDYLDQTLVSQDWNFLAQTGAISSADLANRSVAILPTPNKPYSQSEISAYLDFVRAGGGLIILGGQGLPDSINALTDNFGIHFMGGTVTSTNHLWDKDSFYVTNFVQNDPVTEGVKLVTANWMAPVAVSSNVKVLAWTDGDTNSSTARGPFPFVASTSYGGGRVVLIADHLFDDSTLPAWSDDTLLSNSMAWVCQPKAISNTVLQVDDQAQGQRVDVGSRVSISFRFISAIDGSYPAGATLTMGNYSAIVSKNGWANFSASEQNPGKTSYIPTAGSESTGVLRLLVANGGPVSVIWDEVAISLNCSGTAIVGSNATITWSGHYAYDGSPFNGKVILNDTTTKSTPGVYTYTVSRILDNRYNLTAFTSNSVTVTFVSQQPSTTTTTTGTTTSSQVSAISITTSSGGAGGIPEFPYQALALALCTVLLVVSYLAIRHRRTSFSR